MASFGHQPSGKPRSWVAISQSVAASTVAVLPVFLLGALSVQIRTTLGVDESRIGFAAATFFAGAAIGSFGLRWTPERFGALRMLALTTAGSSIAMLLISTTANRWVTLMILEGLAGFADGILQPSANLNLSQRVHTARQATAYGIKQASVPAATLLGGVAVPALALTVGWQWAFAGAGLFGLVLAGELWLGHWRLVHGGQLRRPRLGHWRLEPGRSQRSRTLATPHAPSEQPTKATTLQRARENTTAPVLAHAVKGVDWDLVVPLALGAGLAAGAANALGAFLVAGAVARHVSPGSAGVLFAVASASSLAARLLAGILADRHQFRVFLVVSAMLLVGSLGYLGLVFAQSWWIMPAALVAFSAAWGWNGLFNYGVARAHPGSEASATGFTQGGVFVGSIIGPLAFGLVAVHVSYAAGWAGCAGAAVVAGVLMAITAGEMKRERPEKKPGSLEQSAL